MSAAEDACDKIGHESLISYLEEQAMDCPAVSSALFGKVLPLQVICIW
ncbi:hypothetical protein [Bartonella vinsonii]|nr:hypothetical protein [Bartonella vinsonii]